MVKNKMRHCYIKSSTLNIETSDDQTERLKLNYSAFNFVEPLSSAEEFEFY